MKKGKGPSDIGAIKALEVMMMVSIQVDFLKLIIGAKGKLQNWVEEVGRQLRL